MEKSTALPGGFFTRKMHDLSALEKRVVEHFLRREHISRDQSAAFEAQLTLGQRLADRVAAFGGSWPFVISFLVCLAAWVTLNSIVLMRIGHPFDPYPYILLNLFLSTLAAIQAPVILMSQNRQAARDRSDAVHDYEVNLKAELEVMSLHEKIDRLREQQWAALEAVQKEQLDMLRNILETVETRAAPSAREAGKSEEQAKE